MKVVSSTMLMRQLQLLFLLLWLIDTLSAYEDLNTYCFENSTLSETFAPLSCLTPYAELESKDAALKKAIQLGGTLPAPSSSSANFVLASVSTSSAWLGLTCRSLTDCEHDGRPQGYLNFAPNSLILGNCVTLDKRTGFWNSVDCGNANAFVVETRRPAPAFNEATAREETWRILTAPIKDAPAFDCLAKFSYDQYPVVYSGPCKPNITNNATGLSDDYESCKVLSAASNSRKTAVLSFRPTTCPPNATTLFQCPELLDEFIYAEPVNFTLANGTRVGEVSFFFLHAAEMLLSRGLADHIDVLIANGFKLDYRGYSLGCCLAQVTAMIVNRPDLFASFQGAGCPRCGSADFTQFFQRMAPENFFAITHASDPVPHQPPFALGYWRAGREIHFSGNMTYDTPFTLCTASESIECTNRYTLSELNGVNHQTYFGDVLPENVVC